MVNYIEIININNIPIVKLYIPKTITVTIDNNSNEPQETKIYTAISIKENEFDGEQNEINEALQTIEELQAPQTSLIGDDERKLINASETLKSLIIITIESLKELQISLTNEQCEIKEALKILEKLEELQITVTDEQKRSIKNIVIINIIKSTVNNNTK